MSSLFVLHVKLQNIMCVDFEFNNPEKNAVNVTFTTRFNCSNMLFKNDLLVKNAILIIRTVFQTTSLICFLKELFYITSIFNS